MSLSSDSRNLDVLRALAVSLVLTDHILLATLGLRVISIASPIGTAGVLFFFVHTCTVLMLSLERDDKTSSFYVRRFFRIYPLSILTVFFVVGLQIPVAGWPLEHYLGFSTKEVIANLTLTQNIFAARNVINILWSLPLEVQMYAIMPFVFRMKINAVWLWAGSALVAWEWSKYGIHAPEVGLWRTSFTPYMPCFIPGVIAYRQSRTAKRWIPSYLWIPAVLLLAVLFVAAQHNHYEEFNFRAAWVICLALGLAIPRFQEFKTARIAHVIAKYSYGIYVSHLICLWFAFNSIKTDSLAIKLVVFLIGLAVVPFVLYHAIEHPFIELGKRLTRPTLAVAASAAATASTS